ncbi:MAG: methyltransferase [Pseudomonadota bacterium]
MNHALTLTSSAAIVLLLAACGGEPADTAATDAPAADATAAADPAPAPAAEPAAPAGPSLDAILDAQPEDVQARFAWRNPKETLEFFGVEPGMTVVEALPGGGWYSKILLPFIGDEGHLIGVNYNASMWPLFGFFSDEQLAEAEVWTDTWPTEAGGWTDSGAEISAYEFGEVAADAHGTADVVLLVRALHNLNRFEGDGGYFSQAATDVFDLLKPGGVLGVVQHQAPDEWGEDRTDGSRGYLNKAWLIAQMESAGFVLEGESGINHNHNDQPGDNDVVWRLPPTLATSRDNEELRKELQAVGESNRMTLKFRKPS